MVKSLLLFFNVGSHKTRVNYKDPWHYSVLLNSHQGVFGLPHGRITASVTAPLFFFLWQWYYTLSIWNSIWSTLRLQNHVMPPFVVSFEIPTWGLSSKYSEYTVWQCLHVHVLFTSIDHIICFLFTVLLHCYISFPTSYSLINRYACCVGSCCVSPYSCWCVEVELSLEINVVLALHHTSCNPCNMRRLPPADILEPILHNITRKPFLGHGHYGR